MVHCAVMCHAALYATSAAAASATETGSCGREGEAATDVWANAYRYPYEVEYLSSIDSLVMETPETHQRKI